MKLNLGCGSKIIEGFVNIDMHKAEGVDLTYDLERSRDVPLPFECNSVSVVYLSHVLEHLKNFFPLMEEIYRVCQTQAVVVVRVPAFNSDEAWIDPTHVRPWHPRSFNYFSQPKYHKFDYGFKADFQPCRAVYVLDELKLKELHARSTKPGSGGPSIKLDDVFSIRGLWTELVMYLTVHKPARPRSAALLSSAVAEVAINTHLINIPSFGVSDLA